MLELHFNVCLTYPLLGDCLLHLPYCFRNSNSGNNMTSVGKKHPHCFNTMATSKSNKKFLAIKTATNLS